MVIINIEGLTVIFITQPYATEMEGYCFLTVSFELNLTTVTHIQKVWCDMEMAGKVFILNLILKYDCVYIVPANHTSLISNESTFQKCLLMLLVQVCNNTEASILEHKVSKRSWFTLQIPALFPAEYFSPYYDALIFQNYIFIFYGTNFLEQRELYENDNSQ